MARTKQTARGKKRPKQDNGSTEASASQPKKAKKSYFSNKAQFSLRPGLKGFLATCNFREKDCVREAINILSEYADKMFGEDQSSIADKQPQNTKKVFTDSDNEDGNEETQQEKTEGNEASQDSDVDNDIEDELAREVDNLKQERISNPAKRRFQVIESGADNNVFIRTTVEDPVSIVHSILEDIQASSKQKTRFLLRLLPIEVTCKAWPDDIKAASGPLLDKYFKGEPKTFCVVFKRRNNGNVLREDVIEDLAAEIKLRNPLHRADMKQPDLAVVVEVIRNICLMSVVPKYFHFKKYNLIEVAKPKVQGDADGTCKSEERETESENITDSSSAAQHDELKTEDAAD